MPDRPVVLCVSWDPGLAATRRLLLTKAGYHVVSALYDNEALVLSHENADAMVLGHSVPQEEKRKLIRIFRQHSSAPVVSLLRPLQEKLPEATFGIESMDPQNLIRVLHSILPTR